MKRLLSFVAILLVIGAFSVARGAPAQAATGGGNSWAAHQCQQGGYLSLVGADGTTFHNTGECVSYADNGGTFATPAPGLWIIPAGQTVTLSGAWIHAWNGISYGYQLNYGANVEVGSKSFLGAGDVYPADVTIGPFDTAVLLRLYLSDATSVFGSGTGGTFYSDGTPVNHTLVVGSTSPYTVYFRDSGTYGWAAGIERIPTPAVTPEGNWNLMVTVTMS